MIIPTSSTPDERSLSMFFVKAKWVCSFNVTLQQDSARTECANACV